MKLYEVTTIKIRANGEFGDEFQDFLGFDFEEAKLAKEEALKSFSRLPNRYQKSTVVEARVYQIEDDVDVTDKDAIIDAMCDCGGYNLF